MLTFNLKNFIISLCLLWVEIGIAIFIHDSIIRPFFGDFLSVILVYFFLKSFLRINNLKLAFCSLFFAYFIEMLQYLDFLTFSGLRNYRIIAIILGSSFDWRDMLAYTLGACLLILLNRKYTVITL